MLVESSCPLQVTPFQCNVKQQLHSYGSAVNFKSFLATLRDLGSDDLDADQLPDDVAFRKRITQEFAKVNLAKDMA